MIELYVMFQNETVKIVVYVQVKNEATMSPYEIMYKKTQKTTGTNSMAS